MPLTVLDNISIATPCTADWEAMTGDDRRRLCKQCSLHVYDLSAMTRAEAVALFAEHESPCVRLFRRLDGRIITQDCPVALARVRQRVAKTFSAAAGLVTMILGAFLTARLAGAAELHAAAKVKKVCNVITGTTGPMSGGATPQQVHPLMGKIARPVTRVTPKPVVAATPAPIATESPEPKK